MATFVLDPAIHTTACIPRMIRTYQRRQYRDKQFEGGELEWKKKLAESSTVYVGNLSCYTNEYQLYELFTRCGSIKRIIMGLDKIKKTPCGFCFVEFDKRESALKSINFLNKAHLDGREIQVDIDAGFMEGRQYGRGVSGGQVGDERRREFAGQQGAGGPRAPQGGTAILTRSITIVACLAILLMISNSPHISANALDTTIGRTNRYTVSRSQFFNPIQIRQGQLGASRDQFEKNFAQFLVNLMKAAKPSLLKAFIQATLADKQLKEIAIGLFFNNTSTGDEE